MSSCQSGDCYFLEYSVVVAHLQELQLPILVVRLYELPQCFIFLLQLAFLLPHFHGLLAY